MAQKLLVFNPQTLVNLLTHYTEGVVPLGSEVVSFGVNPFLERFIGIEVESDEWDGFEPLQIRYEGKKIMSWHKQQGEKEMPIWNEAPEAPTQKV